MAAATPVEKATISCLTNARYHATREAWLDTVHRWFMFFVIALGAAALADALPITIKGLLSIEVDETFVKELCSAGAAVIAALDLTFDLSNRARAHSMMKRRYFELLASLREGKKTPDEVDVCLDEFSADEEPPYQVVFLASWNAAQRTVYGESADQFKIGPIGNLFKNWFRRPGATYKVKRGG